MLFRVSCIQVCIDRASSIRCAFESHSSSVSHLFNKAHHLCEELLLHSGQMSGRLKTALLGLFLPENLQLNVQKLYSLSPTSSSFFQICQDYLLSIYFIVLITQLIFLCIVSQKQRKQEIENYGLGQE